MIEAVRSIHGIIRRKDRFPVFEENVDPERAMSILRLNGIFDQLDLGPDVSSIKAALRDETVSDTYSYSQQVGNLFYLYKSGLLSEDKFIADFSPEIYRRLLHISKNYEFKRNNLWFTNHLLNNYRSLILFPNYNNETICTAAHTISRIISENMDTLFFPGTLISVEGSTNYEILIAKHCYEISLFSTIGSQLDELIAGRLSSTRRYFENNYFWGKLITLPNFGDNSPDWSKEFSLLFLKHFAKNEMNAYGRLVV